MKPKSKWQEFKFVFRALRNRNYKLFFCGQILSLIGTWMQQIAMSWLVYRLTGSELWLGVVGFAGQIPTLLITPFAGVLSDRHNRQRILLATQILSMLVAVILFIFVVNKTITVWHILILSLFTGLINSFDIPVRQAFTVDMIDRKEDLANAIALNSSMVNIARLLGPSLAGILIAAAGEGLCFLINAVSYLAAIGSLLAMKIAPKILKSSGKHILHDLKEGVLYAFHSVPIRSILLLLALVSLTGVPYQVLMPVFAKEIFHGGPRTLGFLMAMSGVGALSGAIYLAGRKSVIGLSRIIAVGAAVFGLSIIVFSTSRILWLSMLVIGISGFFMMIQMASSNTVLQTIVDDDKRGRVMSFFTVAFIGMMPFGSLMAGGLAHMFGAPVALAAGGVLCVIGTLVFIRNLPAIRAKIRPIYIRKQIIPEPAE